MTAARHVAGPARVVRAAAPPAAVSFGRSAVRWAVAALACVAVACVALGVTLGWLFAAWADLSPSRDLVILAVPAALIALTAFQGAAVAAARARDLADAPSVPVAPEPVDLVTAQLRVVVPETSALDFDEDDLEARAAAYGVLDDDEVAR